MERYEIEQQGMKDGRCKGCKHCSAFTGSGNWSFYGCTHKPYKGKWIAEIKDCPKEQQTNK